MNARQLVAAVSTLTVMVNGAGFVRTGSAQTVAPPTTGAQTRQVTPSRLSYLDGDVSFWRPGAQDWTPARLNTALAPGDALYTGQRANVEIQIGTRRIPVHARPVLPGDDDRDRFWKIVNDHNRNRYRAYQKATSRPIPIVALTPR